MLTFIPLYENGEPVVRPPKKGEWYWHSIRAELRKAEIDLVFVFPIYLAVESGPRLAAERALVEACEAISADLGGAIPLDYLQPIEKALADARAVGIGLPSTEERDR